MNFITQVATLEHNIGYKKSSLLIKMFGTNLNIEKRLKRKAMEMERHQTPKGKKRQRQTPSKDYEGGAF